MRDPYEILGLDHDADAETVRRRYLELVRQYSPERAPQEFGEIRGAYDRLRDPVVNLESRLFNLTASHTLESLLADREPDVRQQRLSTEILLSLGRS
ncbi:MAG: J domain-containing protein [Pirellulaceae bacterium]